MHMRIDKSMQRRLDAIANIKARLERAGLSLRDIDRRYVWPAAPPPAPCRSLIWPASAPLLPLSRPTRTFCGANATT